MNAKTTIPADRVTAKVIAKKYAVSESAVYKWKDAGAIPFIRINGTIRFDLAAVVEAIEGK